MVTIAITSSIVNRSGPITPMSSPTLITISSIMPRAFISEPTASEIAPRLTGEARAGRAADDLAGDRDGEDQQQRAEARADERIRVVFSPASAKKIGISTMIATYSMRSINAASSDRRAAGTRRTGTRRTPHAHPAQSVTYAHREGPDQQRREQRACGLPSVA